VAVVSPYLVAVCWTHLSRAFLAPPCSGRRGLLLTGGLVVSELSTEEVLLERAWSAGRLLVNSSICTTGERAIERERIFAIEKAELFCAKKTVVDSQNETPLPLLCNCAIVLHYL
jgi:hypothetical protein